MIEMEFQRLVKSIVENILGKNEKGRFRTIGFQREETSAEENLDNDRSVQTFYQAGDFPKGASKSRGPFQHDVTIRLEFTVAVASKGDIATVVDENSTQEEVIAAMRTFQNSSSEADRLMDELFAIVYQILMSGKHYDMGLPPYTLANRWVSGFQKNSPMERGQYAILTAALLMTGRVVEEVDGDVGVPGTEGVNATIGVNDDSVQKSGVTVL